MEPYLPSARTGRAARRGTVFSEFSYPYVISNQLEDEGTVFSTMFHIPRNILVEEVPYACNGGLGATRSNVLYTVVSGESEFHAVQILDRNGGAIFASTEIRVGRLSDLVAEVPEFLIRPNFLDSDPTDSVSHLNRGSRAPKRLASILRTAGTW